MWLLTTEIPTTWRSVRARGRPRLRPVTAPSAGGTSGTGQRHPEAAPKEELPPLLPRAAQLPSRESSLAVAHPERN